MDALCSAYLIIQIPCKYVARLASALPCVMHPATIVLIQESGMLLRNSSYALNNHVCLTTRF